MPVRVWLPADFEAQLLSEADAYRRRVEQLRADADLGTGLALADYADLWPQLQPEAAVAFAGAGVDPLSEAARLAVERSVRADVFSGPLGGLVTPTGQPAQSDRPPRQPVPQEDIAFGERSLPDQVRRGLSNTAGAVVRGTMLGFSIGQEVSAGISSLGEAIFDGESDGIWGDAWSNFTNDAARSEIGIAIGELNRRIKGDGFQWNDLWRDSEEFVGDGLLPGGQVRERRESDKQRLQLDGTWVSPGRLVSRVVSDPGTTPYNTVSGIVDAGASVFLDPLNYLLPGAAARGVVARGARSAAEDGSVVANVARRALPGLRSHDERTALATAEQVSRFLPELAGTALNGRAPAVDGRRAIDLLGGTSQGRRLVRWLTDEQSPSRIHELSGNQIPIGVARRLAETSSPEEIIRYLGDEVLGARVRNVKAPRISLTDEGYQARTPLRDRTFDATRLPGVRRQLNGIRIVGDKPGRRLDPSRPEEMVRTFADHARNAKIAESEWRPLADRLANVDAAPDRFSQINEINRELLTMIGAQATDRGTASLLARQMTRQVSRYNRELRSYAEDRMGNPFGHYGEDWITVGGERVPLPSPIVMAQAANEVYWLPDATTVRRSIGAFSRITSSTGWNSTNTLLNWGMSALWAPAALLRVALPVRVVGENAARMAFNGLDSAFSHPMRWISWAIGESDGRLADLAARVGLEGQGGGEHVLRLMNEAGASSQRLGMSIVGRGEETVPMPARELFNNDMVKYEGNHPLKPTAWAQRLAMMAGDDEVRAVAAHGVDGHAAWLLSGDGRDVLNQLNRSIFRHRPIETADQARRHAQDIDRWIKELTGGNVDLRDGIANGQVLDLPVTDTMWDSRELAAHLEAEGFLDSMPPVVRGSSSLDAAVDGDARYALVKRWDAALDRMFGQLLGRWEDTFNRAPAFRQYYAERLREAAAYADQATYDDLVTYAADQLNVDISDAVRNGKDAFTEFEDAAAMAQDYAAGRVKGLLYDTHRRSNAADAFRLVYPFLDPWRDVITTWTKTVGTNPIALQRGRQVSAQVGAGDGYFADNDYGESEFRVPIASQLFNWIAGGNERAQVGATGRTLGLNLIGSSVTPGVGPVMTLPMSVLLPQKPEWSFIENELFPFGRPGDQGEGFSEQVLDAMLPSWGRRLKTAFADPESDRNFANRVADVMRVLAASGDYLDEDGGIGPEGQRRLVEDATRRARWLHAFSAAATFVTPTPTNFRFEADTPDGAVTFNALSREYAKLQEEDPTTATERFIERFGSELGPLMANRSYSTSIRQVGRAGALWEQEHKHLEEFAPNTLGVFAPQYSEAEDELDPGAFARQFVTGDREHYSPEDFLWVYNNIVGQSAYYGRRNDMGEAAGTEEGRAILSTFREVLRERYPGYDATSAVRREMPVDTQVAEIINAVRDSPELADTEAGQAIRRYLSLREAVIDAGFAESNSVTAWQTSTSAEMVELRRRLRDAGEDLVVQYPDFAAAFDRVFVREFREDDPTGPPVHRRASLPAWLEETA